MPANANLTRSRRVLILGGYGALLVVFLAAAVVPYVHGTAAANAAIARAQNEIEVNLQKKGQLADVEKRSELVRRQVANYPRLVPENQDLGDFLGKLSGELEAAGMKDMDHKALASIALGRIQKLPIELRGAGSFEQFRTFLTRLEHLPRMSSIGRLNVEADTDMTGRVNVELLLYIYNTKPG